MRSSGISELKILADMEELVAPLKYINPKRDKHIFFDFVREYGEKESVSLNFEVKDFVENYKKMYGNFISSINERIAMHRKGYDNFLSIANSGIGLVVMPFTYPVFGGDYWIELDENNPTITLPRYKGIKPYFFGDGEIHEMMHFYHAVLTKDLKNRGLIESNGLEIEKSEPPAFMRKAPSKKSLKNYERMILEGIIEQEKKVAIT